MLLDDIVQTIQGVIPEYPALNESHKDLSHIQSYQQVTGQDFKSWLETLRNFQINQDIEYSENRI